MNVKEAINIDVLSYDWKGQTVNHNGETVEIAKLISKIESGYYRTKKGRLKVKDINIAPYGFQLENLFDFIVHYKLVEKCDLSYPIVVDKYGDIIDGRHRLAKAILQDVKYIDYIQLLE